MPKNKIGSEDARKIVANLAFRYRCANRHFKKFEFAINYHAKAEAWNAYQSSKKILFGIEP